MHHSPAHRPGGWLGAGTASEQFTTICRNLYSPLPVNAPPDNSFTSICRNLNDNLYSPLRHFRHHGRVCLCLRFTLYHNHIYDNDFNVFMFTYANTYNFFNNLVRHPCISNDHILHLIIYHVHIHRLHNTGHHFRRPSRPSKISIDFWRHVVAAENSRQKISINVFRHYPIQFYAQLYNYLRHSLHLFTIRSTLMVFKCLYWSFMRYFICIYDTLHFSM